MCAVIKAKGSGTKFIKVCGLFLDGDFFTARQCMSKIFYCIPSANSIHSFSLIMILESGSKKTS